MKFKTIKRFLINNKHYIMLAVVTMFSLLLFEYIYLFKQYFDNIINFASYLTWHNIFEFIAILVSFSIFIIQYYAYNHTRRLRGLFLGHIFLMTGVIEAFHTLSFKGMPEFFISNTDANRATTLWIILSLINAIGLLIGVHIQTHKKSKLNKLLFLIPSLSICMVVFIVVTYYPNLLPPMFIEGKGLTIIKIYIERFICILFVAAVIVLIIDYKKTKDYLNMLFACAIILRIFGEYAFVRYIKVDDIYNFLGHLFLFSAYFLFFKVSFVYNIQQPYMRLAKAKAELKGHAENLDRIVNERTRELKEINHKLLEDIEYARDIQRAMLPTQLPEEREVSFYAEYFPMERVGGDFYNIFKLDEKNIGMYIGDVSGHGVSAAMLTVFINQSISTIKETNGNDFDIIRPSKVLKKVYEEFNRINFKDDVYLVMFYAIYNFKTKELIYSSAGMNVAPLIINTLGGVKEIETSGFPICKFSEFYSANYVDESIVLSSGDKVLFHTDGITDAIGKNNERFSEKRLIDIVGSNCNQSSKEIGEIITKQIFNFANMNELNDDITFFIMQVK